MTIASLYPSIRPSLLLDFANTKQLDPRITFSRPTTATYYDGKTVVKAEENRLTYSQDFTNASWQKLNGAGITANAAIGPDGTMSANKLTVNTANAYRPVQQPTLTPVGTQATISVYLKAGELTWAALTDTATFSVFINLSTGALGSTVGSPTATSIASAGNGWYRVSLTMTSASSGSGIAIVATNADGVFTFAGANNTDGIYIWGAQLEQRSTVTAYTPTTTAPITNYIPALQTAVSNDARFDHDPVTGESKGLLIEEQRTNLLTYSEQFDLFGLVNGTVTPNIAISPSGALTADLGTTNGSSFQVAQGVTITSGASVTGSVYLKANGINDVEIVLLSNSNTTPYARATFNVSTGVISVAVTTANGGTNASASITSVGNGWHRCAVTVTYPAVTAAGMRINAAGATGGIYIWGAQLEAGSFPTSYIPTGASQVTRSADSASMTGSNFSSWYRADEGTVYCEAAYSSSSSVFPFIASINDSTSSNYFGICKNGPGLNNIVAEYVVANTFQAQFSISSASANTNFKFSTCYKFNDFAASLNSSAASTDNLGTVPVVTQLNIGSRSGALSLNGTIKKFAYYPKRLSNAELQGLTS